MFLVARTAGKNKHSLLPVAGDLQDDVRACAKTEKPNGLAPVNFAEAKSAIPDNTRTQQRRGMCIVKDIRDRINKVLVNADGFGKPAVRVKARKANVLTQVFAVRAEPFALWVYPVEPRDANASPQIESVRA